MAFASLQTSPAQDFATAEGHALPGSSDFEERADLHLIEMASGQSPRRDVTYRAVRLLLLSRTHAERLMVIGHVVGQGDFETVGAAAGLTSARAKELFNGLVHREAAARARIQRLRKMQRRDAKGKGRRTGKATPQDGPIIPRLNSNLASSYAGESAPLADADNRGFVGRPVSDRPAGQRGQGDAGGGVLNSLLGRGD